MERNRWSHIKEILLLILAVLFLTVITQTGGVLLFLCWPWLKKLRFRLSQRWARRLTRVACFVCLHFMLGITVVPWLASTGGRVPLPVTHDHLKPVSYFTVLLNRHYVDEELYEEMVQVANRLGKQKPSLVIGYLDANFPFIDGFPLLPHLSHKDGKKLDLAFIYNDMQSGELLPAFSPSLTGYGIFEEAVRGESSTVEDCRSRGHFQYNFTALIGWDLRAGDYQLNEKATHMLIMEVARSRAIGKIFLEPHLKKRWGLSGEGKIRFHGCHAVRHDDHIHVQLR